MAKDETKTTRSIRFTTEDLELFERAAEARGEDSVSAWIRRTLREAARKQTSK